MEYIRYFTVSGASFKKSDGTDRQPVSSYSNILSGFLGTIFESGLVGHLSELREQAFQIERRWCKRRYLMQTLRRLKGGLL